ncbi:hypothetical protein [Nocardia sp. NPDC020380]|uniref:hypothetical protein n=1 Tax=Nocardia sp. NPDC020380 TaxID=3364309 RepID=UPI0037BCA168
MNEYLPSPNLFSHSDAPIATPASGEAAMSRPVFSSPDVVDAVPPAAPAATAGGEQGQ